MIWRKAIGLLRRLEVNRAVFFSILTQAWSTLAGPVTLLVVAYRLSAVEQGFYYTFNSVLALQVFVELGLATVIVQVASHEWAFLKRESDGRISGDPRALSRLASLMSFAFKWYAVSGLLVIVGLSVGGFIFFSAKPYPEVAWQLPWFALCGFVGLALIMSPIFSVIEGCNQVASIYAFRFVHGALSSIVVIGCIALGLGLYSLVVAAVVRLICGSIFILWKHWLFVQQIVTSKTTRQINWREEVWPFQWRIGVSWISGYFVFSIFTPVMFYFHGAKIAGQMGMTLSLVNALVAVAYSWLNIRTPQFGVLIALGDYHALDRMFKKLLTISVAITLLGSIAIWSLVFWLSAKEYRLAGRLLPLLPLGLFLAQAVLSSVINGLAVYLRAHKKEPLVVVSVICAVLIGASTIMLGRAFGPNGASAGFLAATALWSLPASWFVFHKSKKKWHSIPQTLPC